jgi:hypothetical protein
MMHHCGGKFDITLSLLLTLPQWLLSLAQAIEHLEDNGNVCYQICTLQQQFQSFTVNTLACSPCQYSSG